MTIIFLMEHKVNFNISASYYTLNELTDLTTDIWIVCHGFGQLAEHFIRRFDILNPDKNFVIAPQGLSKFYMDNYQKVGASWMTKLNKEVEIDNQQNYFDAVISDALQGKRLSDFKVHLLGFSQGVSVVCRMAAYAKIDFKHLMVWAGGFPLELKEEDFAHLSEDSKVTVIIGDQDELVPMNERFEAAVQQAEKVLNRKVGILKFDGGHEVKRDVLRDLVD